MSRAIRCAVIAALSMTAAGAAAAAPQTRTVPEKVSYVVQTFNQTGKKWSVFSRYSTEKDARTTAEGLAKNGIRAVALEVRVKGTEFVPANPNVKPAAPVKPAGKVPTTSVNWAKAKELFENMKDLDGKGVAFKFPGDGCYARAHIMCEELKKLGVMPHKAWAFAGSKDEPLYVTTYNHPRKHVTWSYHVAPTVYVCDFGLSPIRIAYYAIDPSLFDEPVTIETWKNKMVRPGAKVLPRTEMTDPGKAPLVNNKRQGIGYGPADKLPATTSTKALDDAAWGKMKEYKPYQGKWHPTMDKDCPAYLKKAAGVPGSTNPVRGVRR